jgi:hypothetical protein
MHTPSEQTVLDLAQHFTPLAYNLARKWNLDADDVKQDIVEIIITTLPRVPDITRDVKPYLNRAIVNHFLSAHAEKYTHKPAYVLSLDAPLADNPDCTRADLLAAPADVPTDDTLQVERERALYAALHRLRYDEQLHLRRVFGLHEFKARRNVVWGQRKTGQRSARSLSTNAYKKLRSDAVLSAALEVTR